MLQQPSLNAFARCFSPMLQPNASAQISAHELQPMSSAHELQPNASAHSPMLHTSHTCARICVCVVPVDAWQGLGLMARVDAIDAFFRQVRKPPTEPCCLRVCSSVSVCVSVCFSRCCRKPKICRQYIMHFLLNRRLQTVEYFAF